MRNAFWVHKTHTAHNFTFRIRMQCNYCNTSQSKNAFCSQFGEVELFSLAHTQQVNHLKANFNTYRGQTMWKHKQCKRINHNNKYPNPTILCQQTVTVQTPTTNICTKKNK